MQRKIKIGYFIDTDLNRGGAPLSTKVLIEGVSSNKKYQCTLIKPSSKHKTDYYKDNVDVINVDTFYEEYPFMLFHPFKWLKLVKNIKSILDDNHYDIIHAQMPSVGMAIGLLKRFNKISKDTILVYTIREDVSSIKWYHRIRYKYFIGNSYDYVIAISNRIADYWRKSIGCKRQFVLTIYNTATKLYESYDKPKSNKILKIMFAGRISRDKNWKLAMEIAEKIANSNIHITFVMSFFNDSQKKMAMQMQHQLEKYDNIEFLFNLGEAAMKHQFVNSDIFLMTSIREGFGRTAVEAMSQKTVVIGTNVGGIPEVVGKPENVLGLDCNQFVNRIKEYQNNDSLLKKDKDFFYNRYLDCFSVKINIDKHIDFYNRILEMDDEKGR